MDMADNLGMTDQELIQAYEAAKREAEGWSDTTDGSAGLAYAQTVAPLERELRARGLMLPEGQGPAQPIAGTRISPIYAARDMAGLNQGESYTHPEWWDDPRYGSDDAERWAITKYLTDPYANGEDISAAIGRDAPEGFAERAEREYRRLMESQAAGRAQAVKDARSETERRMAEEAARYSAKHPRTPYTVKNGQYVRDKAPLGEWGQAKAAFGRKLDQAQRWLDENVWKVRPKSVKAATPDMAGADERTAQNAAMRLAGLNPKARGVSVAEPFGDGSHAWSAESPEAKMTKGQKKGISQAIGALTPKAPAVQAPSPKPNYARSAANAKQGISAGTASYSTDKKPVF